MRLTSSTKPGLISIKNLSIYLNSENHNKTIIDKLSLSIPSGEIFGISGRSGMGKTSLMLSLLGLLPKSFAVQAEQVSIDGQVIDIAKQGDDGVFAAVRGKRIGYIFQEPKAVFSPTHTVAQSFERIFRSQSKGALPKSAWRDEMIRLLKLAQLPNPSGFLRRYPHELSGGEARRISVAQVLALQPQIIIADEPTGALDAELKDEILKLLVSIVRMQDMALVLISHDLPSLVVHCDRLMVMDQSQCFIGAINQVRAHSLGRQLLAADFGKPIIYHTTDKNILTVQNLRLSYQKFWTRSTYSINIPDFHINHGEIIGLMGGSGHGKSSLARAITRLDPRLTIAGQIIINGDDISKFRGTKLRSLRKQTQLVMQEVRSSFNPYLTILDSLLEAVDGGRSTAVMPMISELLELCGLSPNVLSKLPHEISGGECQRLCIVRALLARPGLLILDEPTTMLDRIATAQFLALLRKINQEKATTILLISHDREVIDAVCHRVVLL